MEAEECGTSSSSELALASVDICNSLTELAVLEVSDGVGRMVDCVSEAVISRST